MDALEVMRRSMIASHNAAAAEAKKDKKANPEKIAASLAQAAEMAKSIAAVEDRRRVFDPAVADRGPLVRPQDLRGLSHDELDALSALVLKARASAVDAGGVVPEMSDGEKWAHEVVKEVSAKHELVCSERDRLRDLVEHWQSEFSRVVHEREQDRLAGGPGRAVGGDGTLPAIADADASSQGAGGLPQAPCALRRQASTLAHGAFGAAADQGGRNRACQQHRANGLGHDGKR